MADDAQLPNCDDKTEAVLAADRLLDRMQGEVAAQLKPDSGVEAEQGYGQLIEELETAPEVRTIRAAAERPSAPFGSQRRDGPTPAAPEDHPS
jgi:hypothetical protein